MNLQDTSAMLDLNKTIAGELFSSLPYPWLALKTLSAFITALGETLSEDEYERLPGDIWVSKCADVAKNASLTGPLIVDHGAEIRHCAFIRGSAIIGKGAVVGNSTEVKNALLFDKAQAPHYNYVGDSILGYAAHMGAGAITSNLKSDKSSISVKYGDMAIDSGLRKFGAILADFVEIGCNCVLNPGTVVLRNSTVYPLSSVRGVVPENSIYKRATEIVLKKMEG